MKANELRIGNLIYYNNKIREVESIHLSSDGEYYIQMKGIEVLDNVEKISHIPLTEEILVKFWFNKTEFTCDKIESYYSLRLSDDKYVDLCLITDAGNCGIAYLFPYGKEFYFRYVHELQNLYFALTREELNVLEILK